MRVVLDPNVIISALSSSSTTAANPGLLPLGLNRDDVVAGAPKQRRGDGWRIEAACPEFRLP